MENEGQTSNTDNVYQPAAANVSVKAIGSQEVKNINLLHVVSTCLCFKFCILNIIVIELRIGNNGNFTTVSMSNPPQIKRDCFYKEGRENRGYSKTQKDCTHEICPNRLHPR